MLPDPNTDTPDEPDDDLPELPPKPKAKPELAFFLIDALLDKALTPSAHRRLLHAGTTAIVLVPDPSWTGKTTIVLDHRYADARVQAFFASSKRAVDGVDLERSFASGQTLIVVAHDLDVVPAVARTAADLTVRLDAPDLKLIRRAIKAITGKTARGLTQGDIAGKSLTELIAAVRTNSGAAECVARLKPRTDMTQLAPGPDLATLPVFGEAKTWSDEILHSARRLLAGEIASRDVEATLLYGPPGTGKTVLAAAVARSAGMNFVQTSAADWFLHSDGNLGGVLKAADNFFNTLAASAPAVGLIDELDALPDRAAISADKREWWQAVVTGVLLMIGRSLASQRKIILIAATNHPDHIDAAVKRPGRFGRHVYVRPAQSEAEVAAVLSYHLGSELDSAAIAEIAAVAGLPTAAEVEGWVRAARSIASSAGRPMLASDVLDQIAPADTRSAQDLRLVALHEAGHAVAVVALGIELMRVTIAGSESIGGVTTWRGDGISTLEAIERQVIVMLAGRAADVELGGGANNGASTDLQNATQLLVAAESSYGLRASLISRPGDVHQLLTVDRPLFVRIEQHLDRLMTDALALIRSHRAEVLAVADALLARRVLSGDAVRKIIAAVDSRHPQPPVDALPAGADGDSVTDTSPSLKP